MMTSPRWSKSSFNPRKVKLKAQINQVFWKSILAIQQEGAHLAQGKFDGEARRGQPIGAAHFFGQFLDKFDI